MIVMILTQWSTGLRYLLSLLLKCIAASYVILITVKCIAGMIPNEMQILLSQQLHWNSSICVCACACIINYLPLGARLTCYSFCNWMHPGQFCKLERKMV